jgi:hypothetical protein
MGADARNRGRWENSKAILLASAFVLVSVVVAVNVIAWAIQAAEERTALNQVCADRKAITPEMTLGDVRKRLGVQGVHMERDRTGFIFQKPAHGRYSIMVFFDRNTGKVDKNTWKVLGTQITSD